MDPRHALLMVLADGACHGSRELAGSLGCGRDAVRRHVSRLRRAGVAIRTVRGAGYQASDLLELLSGPDIRTHIDPGAREDLAGIQCAFETDSTNRLLSSRPGAVHGHVAVAETQTGGRGRRGRTWYSPPAAGLWLSVGWRFPRPPRNPAVVSLAAAVAVIHALERHDIRGALIKWPNDIVHGDCKLGGILIESTNAGEDGMDAVIGIGLNIRLPVASPLLVDQPVTDAARISGLIPSRNRLAGAIISEVFAVMRRGSDPAFSPVQEWRRYDAAAGRQGRLILPDRELSGQVRGIDADGNLLLLIGDELRSFPSGELSLRFADESPG